MSAAWTIKDGAMVLPDGTGKGKGNDIVTDNEFTNFELSIEWKIVEGGNSGIFWGVKEGRRIQNSISNRSKKFKL